MVVFSIKQDRIEEFIAKQLSRGASGPETARLCKPPAHRNATWLTSLRQAHLAAPRASHDICEINADPRFGPHKEATLIHAVQCALGGPRGVRSHTMVVFDVAPQGKPKQQSRSGVIWIYAGYTPTSILAKLLVHCTTLIVYMKWVPPKGYCNYNCRTPNDLAQPDAAGMRQSLSYILPQLLRVLPERGLVLAQSPHACMTPGDRYVLNRKFAVVAETCWVERFEELAQKGGIAPVLLKGELCAGLAACRINRQWQIAQTCPEYPRNGTRTNGTHRSHSGRSAWCVATRMATSACRARSSMPPLLDGATARQAVHFRTSKGAMEAGMPVGMPNARYFSAFSCSVRTSISATPICLLFKDHTRERMLVLASSPDGVHFGAWSKLLRLRRRVTPSSVNSVRVSTPLIAGQMLHNLALLQEPLTAGSVERWVLVGGTYRYEPRARKQGDWLVKHHQGIWSVAMDNVLEPERRETVTERLLFDGLHAGCIEQRGNNRFPYLVPRPAGSVSRAGCEFDGRTALVKFRGTYLLYARANMASRGGQRFVQVTSSIDLKGWRPFQPISIADYRSSDGDIYFWAVQVNLVRPSTLLAVFPLVHRMEGCLGIALSLDGVRWSRVTPLLACASVGERTLSHPAAPAMVRANDGSRSVWLYVHENVSGASLDQYMPISLREAHARAAGPSRLVRYTLPMDVLERWTSLAARDLTV